VHRGFLIALLAAVASGCGGGGDARDPAGVIVYWYDNPKPSIWAVRADGPHDRLIVRNRQNAKRPRLSPDRRWVAFDGTPPGEPPLSDFDLQLVRLDGSGLRTLTHTSDWDIDAQWSPDGRRLAFTRTPPHPNGAGTRRSGPSAGTEAARGGSRRAAALAGHPTATSWSLSRAPGAA